jgi:hypothetical protein
MSGELKVTASLGTRSNEELSGDELLSVVSTDVKAFDEFFQTLGNNPLVRSEVAIITTYLHWKIRGADHGKASGH